VCGTAGVGIVFGGAAGGVGFASVGGVAWGLLGGGTSTRGETTTGGGIWTTGNDRGTATG